MKVDYRLRCSACLEAIKQKAIKDKADPTQAVAGLIRDDENCNQCTPVLSLIG